MPAWATRVTHERWSAGIERNHGSSSSMRDTLWVASAPEARSSRRNVAARGSGVSVTAPSLPVERGLVSRRGALTLGLALWLALVLPLALLVHAGWAPLLDTDRAVVDALQPAAADSPAYRGS